MSKKQSSVSDRAVKAAEIARKKSEQKRLTERRKAESKQLAMRRNAEKRQLAARKKAEQQQTVARKKAAIKQLTARKKANALAEKKRIQAERDERYKLKMQRAEKKRKARQAVIREIVKRFKNNPNAFGYENNGVLPRVQLIIDGDPTGIAAALGAKEVPFTDMAFNGGKTSVKIRKKDCGKVIAILSDMCYNYEIGARYGIGRTAAFALSRIGLAAGMAAWALGLFAAYSRVWSINIEGNEVLSEQAVLKVLEGVGVYGGVEKSSLSANAICVALMATDGIADVSCEINGTTLNVHVLESSDCVSPENRTAYVSDYDATITRIVVRSGSALIARGDAVAAGAVLVSGEVYSTAGELMYTAPCDAEVYGNVSLSYTAAVGNTRVDFVRTGKSVQRTVLGFFGYNIGKVSCKYAHYEVVRHTSRYDLLLPVIVTTYTFYETAPTEVEVVPDEVARGMAEQQAEKLQFTGEFEQSYTVAPIGGGMYSVHVFLSGEALISRGV